MKLIITGGTGFIGKPLCQHLLREGHELRVLTRALSGQSLQDARLQYVAWDPSAPGWWEKEMDGAEAIVNLAGESIANTRWSKKQKARILESRVQATQALVHAIQKARVKPKVLVSASAVGYYGPHGDQELTEEAAAGSDFLAQVTKAWEAHALRAADFGLRVVRLRFGVVLEKNGGALQKMLLPFRLGLGGPLGNGRQWMSWIHRDDVIGLITHCLENTNAQGAVNATAPHPVTMKKFAKTLGQTLHRPTIFPAPGFVLKVLLGEMAEALLLSGQRVLPQRAEALGYTFHFPHLRQALDSILQVGAVQ